MSVAPMLYVIQHLAEGAVARDVTGPPPDLSWRSNRKLLLSLLLLAVLIGIGVFSFSPLAKQLATWDGFFPMLMGAFGSLALAGVVTGWRQGRVEPITRGVTLSFERATQPKRYWLAMGWNTLIAAAMFVGSVELYRAKVAPTCDTASDRAALVENLADCTTMLADNALDSQRRAELLAARGRVQHELGHNGDALADYSAALKLDKTDSYTLYNRALIYHRLGNYRQAIADFDASLRLRPDNDEAYLERGIAKLDSRDFRGAVADFTIGHQRDRDDPYPVANRGVAYAWLNDVKRAEADFGQVDRKSPAWIMVARGRAILAKQRSDHLAVIAHATEALKVDPDDAFSLQMRAEAYWHIGEADLSWADDRRLNDLARRDMAQGPDTSR